MKKWLSHNQHSLQEFAHKVGLRLLLVRLDGMVVFDSTSNHTTQGLGALSAGVWQAARSLQKIHLENDIQKEFKLSWETVTDGFYMLPVNVNSNEWILVGVYDQKLVPGKIKFQLNQLKRLLEKEEVPYSKTTAIEEARLFNDISDAEIDRLFSVGF